MPADRHPLQVLADARRAGDHELAYLIAVLLFPGAARTVLALRERLQI